ncbi:hypothetical protein PSYMO_37007, partial [Pseudomonas amygdali pv. mori str. 301020]
IAPQLLRHAERDRRGGLDDLSGVHHRNPVGDTCHQPQVVG